MRHLCAPRLLSLLAVVCVSPIGCGGGDAPGQDVPADASGLDGSTGGAGGKAGGSAGSQPDSGAGATGGANGGVGGGISSGGATGTGGASGPSGGSVGTGGGSATGTGGTGDAGSLGTGGASGTGGSSTGTGGTEPGTGGTSGTGGGSSGTSGNGDSGGAGTTGTGGGSTGTGGVLEDASAGGPNDGGAGDGSPDDAALNDGANPDGAPADVIELPACEGGLTACGNACVNISSDNSHCGDCWSPCGGGKSCVAGRCECPAGRVDCDGSCIDTSLDSNHCGTCGIRCTGGRICAGTCQCPPNQQVCGDTCVDTSSNRLHCGQCDNACVGAGKVCLGGTCQCPTTQLECSNDCYDITSDPNHCGNCTTQCISTQACSGSVCACPGTQVVCSNTCVDTMSNPSFCGGCNTTCGLDQVCSGGSCLTQCGSGLAECSGACVNTLTSPSHCGNCTTACAVGGICNAGQCACPSGQDVCSGICVDRQYDNYNCGQCGHVCPNTTFCELGECRCDVGYSFCNGACISTAWDPVNCGACGHVCSGGTICSNGTCVCPSPLTSCGGVCVNTVSDPLHCGACGVACVGGTCSGGTCVCPPYQSFCDGKCVPTANDPNNCGACGHVCATGEVCVSNACVASCFGGLSACDGTCVDLSTDRDHCGVCTTKCDPGFGCANGSCVPSVPLDPAPAKCANGGPPILLTEGLAEAGTNQECAGDTAATTFPWAICTCHSFEGKGKQTFDAFDSTKAPYTSGGLGAGVGVNGLYNAGSSLACSGTLWSYHDINPGNATVRQELHVGGNLSGTVDVGQTGYVLHPVGAGTFRRDLYTTTCPVPGYSVGTCHADPALAVPAPCQRCEPANQIPVLGYVSYYATHNDNAAIRLSAQTFNIPGAAAVIDLPCGYYYLDRVVTSSSVTITAHGNTALFIGGSIDVKGSFTLTLDPMSHFDVFVAGGIYADGTLSIGSPAYPASMRVYIGGTCKAGGSSCEHDGECCSATCTNHVCAAGSLLPGDPPWSLYMKAQSDIAGNIYAPNGEIFSGASFTAFGAIFAGYYRANSSTTIHYDRASVTQGEGCPPPPSGCSSCLDCGNQACINGACGACTTSAQCCAPLVCESGECKLASGT